MTRTEYDNLYKQARMRSATMSLQARTELRSIYIQASDDVAKKLLASKKLGTGRLTQQLWTELEKDLQSAIKALDNGITKIAVSGVTETTKLYADINTKYLYSAMQDAGVTKVTKAGIEKLGALQSRTAVESMVNRVYQDGYTFSQRVWNATTDYNKSIKEIVAKGMTEGRDPVKICRDIQGYTRDGKMALAKRWGHMKEGSAEWKKRIPKDIDWRALRLVRSEMQASIQDSNARSGEMNCGSTGQFKWLLGPGLTHCDDCISYSAQLFTRETLPGYPHSNCLIVGSMVLTIDGLKPIEDILPGDIVISHNGKLNAVTKTWRNKYDGEMIEVTTSSGKIVMTPDHPVISNGKWVPSKALNFGDDILRISTDIPLDVSAKTKSIENPSMILKNGCFLNIKFLLSSEGVPITAVDFNGKFYIFVRKIDVILKKSKIGNWLFSRYFERIVHKFFIDGKTFTLALNGSLAKFLIGTLSTSDCIMASRDGGNATVSIKSFIPLGNGKFFVSKNGKMSINNVSGNSELFSYLINREILIPEQIVNGSLGNVNFSWHSESIIAIRHLHVNEVVYNLTVAMDHSYIANGFASHNCGCLNQPVLRDRKEFVKDLKAWMNEDSSRDTGYIDTWHDDIYAPSLSKRA